VIGSLTKVFACAGLRLGFVLAPDASLAARLAYRQPQWAVNGVAAAVLPALLGEADLIAWRDGIARLRARPRPHCGTRRARHRAGGAGAVRGSGGRMLAGRRRLRRPPTGRPIVNPWRIGPVV